MKVSGLCAMLGALLSRLFAEAAQEAAEMDRAGACLLAGEARAQRHGNLIVRQYAASRAGGA